MNLWRIIAATLGGAAIASLITNTALYFVVAFFGHENALLLMPAFFGFLIYGFLVSAIATISLGLAWHAFAMKKGWSRAINYWGPAAMCGLVVAFGLWLAIVSGFGVSDPDAWSFLLLLALYASALSASTGYVAWLIRRPDRDSANPDNTAS